MEWKSKSKSETQLHNTEKYLADTFSDLAAALLHSFLVFVFFCCFTCCSEPKSQSSCIRSIRSVWYCCPGPVCMPQTQIQIQKQLHTDVVRDIHTTWSTWTMFAFCKRLCGKPVRSGVFCAVYLYTKLFK